MATILGIGIATLDIINTLDHYPAEDTETRATHQSIRRGGNVTNSLSLLSQLGHQCYWLGSLADDVNADIIKADLNHFNVNFELVNPTLASTTPTSYITHNGTNGSRTIVHYRNLNELAFTDFKRINLDKFDWIHFEARHIVETEQMLAWVKQQRPGMTISIEVEKQRDAIENLYQYADYLIFSKAFCQQSDNKDPESFLKSISHHISNAELILAWGEAGAYSYNDKTLNHYPARKVETIIDSIGAGDSFNAGLISSLIKKNNLALAIAHANHLAAYKLKQTDFDITAYQLPDDSL